MARPRGVRSCGEPGGAAALAALIVAVAERHHTADLISEAQREALARTTKALARTTEATTEALSPEIRLRVLTDSEETKQRILPTDSEDAKSEP
mmetsp:Transcript_5647/g.20424  ORF Transcript_5647/g.20424 Transcript_5647/m.20424 type:complete len:94 (-) Transcript_5647:71-352(-)